MDRPLRAPLDGLLVADFSRVLAGPLAAMTLADLGARVIKVERPGAGDDTRTWGPPWTDNSAAYFESANRNKESVTLDLDDPGDLEAARELARRADVVIENFRVGALDRRGLGYEQVRRDNPGVVYCSVSGFGRTGGAELPGYDFLAQAVGGLMSVTGEPGGRPMKVGVALVDVLTAKDAVIGILAALQARAHSGVGQHVEVNLLSTLLAALVNQAASYLTTGNAPGRLGNAHPSVAPYELLEAADGPFAIACGNDAQFRKLAAAVGDESLADDERFATNAARVQNRAALVDELQRRLAADSAESWVARLTAVGVPAGRVGSVADGFRLAEQLGLDPLVDVGPGRPAQVRNPVSLSETPVTTYTAPPRLGEHSDQVRRWLRKEDNA
ncbi:formyl-CoA transferase [Pseudonocardia thermophila]|jgi:Predicted acyl-CoA transferases/carnitine dehydratase|uniref:Formyl-CoA transferase n=1 Tax=Pseudonocardia thermophila TaxID=1848 RepID=A0A1M6RKH4_PSETH|nr:CoA transferase [Pseudonocardia thermophila]SHK32942.1 formyl-CoA transferase [Pseudonocardia thermophila]